MNKTIQAATVACDYMSYEFQHSPHQVNFLIELHQKIYSLYPRYVDGILRRTINSLVSGDCTRQYAKFSHNLNFRRFQPISLI